MKLAKDACLLVGVLLAACTWRDRSHGLLLEARWPLLALGALVLVHSVLGIARGDALPVLAGLRSYEALPMAVLLAPLVAAPLCVALTRWVAAALLVQLPFLVVEAIRSLPVQKVAPVLYLPWRLSGSLVMPNSLGVFAAAGLVFVLAFEPSRRWRAASVVAALACIAAAGSGAGWVLLSAAGAWWLWRRGGAFARVGALCMPLAVVGLLPWLVLRLDVHDSIRARMDSMKAAAAMRPSELILGGAAGAGATTLGTVDPSSPSGMAGRWWWAGDSGVAALLAQTGIVGLLLAGLAVSLAWRAEAALRPFLLVTSLAAFVLPILDLFPVNLLLALVLARVPAGDAAPNAGVT